MSDRRPIQARNTQWAQNIARALFHIGLTPNSISIFSVIFAGLAGISFYLSACEKFAEHSLTHSLFLVLAAVFIQLRLLCNLFDGMVAIEFGLKSKSGEIFNDFPDRPADLLILIGAGYAVSYLWHGIEIGWLAASLAVLTAYVRVLGKASGASSYFSGPMAKQHRMALITIAALAAAIEYGLERSLYSLWFALIIVALGSFLTCLNRLRKIVRELESK